MAYALFALAVTFLSGTTQIVTGFGFAVVMMALLPLALTSELALYFSLIGGSTLGIWLIWQYRRKIAWKTALIPVLCSLAGTALGIFTNTKVSDGLYTRLLGVALCLMALWMKFFAKRIRIPGTPLAAAIAGAATGLLNALFAMGGPPLVLYYSSILEDKEAYVGTLNMAITASAIFTVISRAILLGIPSQMIYFSAPLLLGLLAAAVVGKRIFNRISADQLRQIIYIFMFIVGVYFTISG